MKLSQFFTFSQNRQDSRNVSYICLMHYFWGVASSMIFTLLPIFIVDELGGSYKSYGLLEGTVIFLSFVSKLFAGFLIDIFKRKRPMFLSGILLTILSKISLVFSFNVLFVFIAKSIDRFAKGLRQAPSDAIFAELSTNKGFAYSTRYMMNIGGNLTGSILTSMIVKMIGNNFRFVFALATIPTIAALFIYNKKLTYKEETDIKKSDKQRWSIKDISRLPKSFWSFIIMASILMFSRFSEGFITLRAKEVLPNDVSNFPLFMALYEVCAVIVALPIGKLSDKIDKKIIFLIGVAISFGAQIVALFANNFFGILMIYLLVGLHMGTTHGLLSSIVAKSAPKELIGTAFAVYYGIDAVALFCSNYIAGVSSKFALLVGLQGSSGPFMVGCISTLTVLCYLVFLIIKGKRNNEAVF